MSNPALPGSGGKLKDNKVIQLRPQALLLLLGGFLIHAMR
jgi:hypothetical protein